MTLAEALALISIRHRVFPARAPEGTVILCSGGVTDNADDPPFLCSTREAAVREWVHALKTYVPAGDAIRWAEEPGIYKYAITMQADGSVQRVAADRFSVVCGLWHGSVEDAKALPPGRGVATGGVR